MSVVLVVAAHPDDEVLGCGGTIVKHVASGDEVHVVFMADGVGSRGGDIDVTMPERKSAMYNAAKILGTSSTTSLSFPDNSMDNLALLDVVRPLEDLIEKISPEVIYTHHYGDLNVDHRLTHQAVMTACRPIPQKSVKEIYTFEVMSSTEWNSPGNSPFIPELFVDISSYIDLKIAALEAYQEEMREKPHSRSIDHIKVLSIHRGHSVGMDNAEAFMVMRVIK